MSLRGGKLTVVAFDDHPANREPQSPPLRLRRNERVEYALQFLRTNSRSGVFRRHENCIAAVTVGSHAQHPAIVLDRIHCFDRVVDQVNQDLLQLTAMANDKGRSRRQLGVGRNAVILQLLAQNLQYAKGQLIHIDWLLYPIFLSKQSAGGCQIPGWRDDCL